MPRSSISLCLVSSVLLGVAVGGPAVAQTATPDPLLRHIHPLGKAVPTPKILIDVSDAPEAEPWAREAKKVAEQWFPHLTQLLATENYKPNETLTLIFKKNIGPPAYASGGDITIKAEWIAANPDDFGMVIHELTHVIQSYPGDGDEKQPGWLVEGIADYIRWWRYEPESPRTPINPQTASYRDSYRTTAWFLAWASARYDRALVRKLDAAMRAGTYAPALFEKSTGKNLDALWAEFITTLPARPAPK